MNKLGRDSKRAVVNEVPVALQSRALARPQAGDTVSTEVGTVFVTLDSDSTWTLTGDSYITSFTGDASNVISNGYTLYVNGVALTGTK